MMRKMLLRHMTILVIFSKPEAHARMKLLLVVSDLLDLSGGLGPAIATTLPANKKTNTTAVTRTTGKTDDGQENDTNIRRFLQTKRNLKQSLDFFKEARYLNFTI